MNTFVTTASCISIKTTKVFHEAFYHFIPDTTISNFTFPTYSMNVQQTEIGDTRLLPISCP